jgi:NADP-dependent 3-hydroxy acid dehydrogenase YdfG
MELQAGQVAIVTGAASGIGRAMADSFASRGLNVVLADIETAAVQATAAEIEAATGIPTLSAVVDVRDIGSLEQVAAATIKRFGRIDVVCNNAGVLSPRGPIWEQDARDWEWVLGVNLIGVVNGIRAFVPHLVAQGHGHVVNTASIAGLRGLPGSGPYTASKWAVVGLSEVLRADLDRDVPEVGVTVLCPGPVISRIRDSDRNRPASLAVDREAVTGTPAAADTRITAETVAALVIAAIESNRLYLVTNPENFAEVRARVDRLLTDLP